MMITFEDIVKANEGIESIDLKGKKYAMVAQRVKAFRKLFPDGFINTQILSLENGICVMKAEAGHFTEDGSRRILGTGTAYEVQGKGLVNGTSYIENCETSCVGRALGFLSLGIDGGGICSAEELVNAITAQNQMKEEEKAACQPPIPENSQIAKAKALSEKAKTNPVGNLIINEITAMQEETHTKSYGEMKAQFNAWHKELIKSGAVKEIGWDVMTMEQAKALVAAIRKTFLSGDGK